MTIYISFSHQFYLPLFLLVPLLIFFHFYGLKNLRGNSLKFANFEAISKIQGVDLMSKNIFSLFINIIVVGLIVLAICGANLNTEITSSKFSYVVAIDCSQSMSATDFLPNRLTAAKNAADQFVDSLPINTKVGVLSFSGDSKIEKILVLDRQEIKTAIDGIDICKVQGTDTSEVIVNSVKLLREEKYKALILISDGEINVGNLSNSIDFAKQNNLMIHTIGIGTVAGGEASYGISKIDENSLKSLAFNTNGKYYNAKDTEAIKSSFKDLVPLTTELGAIDLTPYILFVILILFFLRLFLMNINKLIW